MRIVAPFGGTAAGLTAAFEGDAPNAAVQRFIGTYVWHCHILEHERERHDAPVHDRAGKHRSFCKEPIGGATSGLSLPV